MDAFRNCNSTHEVAMEAALESYALFQMLDREVQRNDEEWFPFVLRAAVQRLNLLNEVQMLMFDPAETPDLEEMKKLMFGRPAGAAHPQTAD